MQRYLFRIDRLSAWSGKAISWLVLVSTLLIVFDVTMRYVSKPLCQGAGTPLCDVVRSVWFTYNYSYDMSYYFYAILFMIGGAYTLSRAQHVRGDMFYRYWPVRLQASIDLALYLFTFFPAVIALMSVGSQWAAQSWEIRERSFTSAAAPPIYPLKAVIPIAGALMFVQGVAEVVRAATALRTGVWPPRLHDVEETETALAQRAAAAGVAQQQVAAALTQEAV